MRNVQITFNQPATVALFTGMAECRVAPFTKARVPSFVGRKVCKTAETLHGYGVPFQINEAGEAVINTPLSRYLERMEDIAPVPGTYYLKRKSANEDFCSIVSAIPEVKDGKVQLVDGNLQVTIAIADDEPVAEVTEETAVIEEPAPVLEVLELDISGSVGDDAEVTEQVGGESEVCGPAE